VIFSAPINFISNSSSSSYLLDFLLSNLKSDFDMFFLAFNTSGFWPSFFFGFFFRCTLININSFYSFSSLFITSLHLSILFSTNCFPNNLKFLLFVLYLIVMISSFIILFYYCFLFFIYLYFTF